MYISRIHIKNYRNFDNFSMEFYKGLNVIIGANNAGKTGLLSAIKLLCSPDKISLHDFNKNKLMKYKDLYKENPPEIVIEYHINHTISESNTEDEAIIRLLPFLGIQDVSEKIANSNEAVESIEYDINAHIKATYSLDSKITNEYKQEVALAKDIDEYLIIFKRFVEKHYSWSYTNGISETKVEQKAAKEIFDIQFIAAERTGEEVRKGTKHEIETFIKKSENASTFNTFQAEATGKLKKILDAPINKLDRLFTNEGNKIGLQKGNVSIASSIQTNISISDAYTTEVRDTKGEYTLPLGHNGLGYNNLINIYMLLQLKEIEKGKDFRILCLEEPEAHLHPSMQYKLFKYLRELDKCNDLNQQIFVTTHSSNISAVAGIDNMFMFAYNRDGETSDCQHQSLLSQFQDHDGETNKKDAKAHLSKFLDVTRSDMLFADKVILVEGIAEKLLMPLFMDKCECPYEDEHISIVEIGGKHFHHFVELFNQNKVVKKILCITDKDFKWLDDKKLNTHYDYQQYKASHITALEERFDIENFHICTQQLGGRTFEDEFFLTNMENKDLTKIIFKKAICASLKEFVDTHGLDISAWIKNKGEIDGRVLKSITKFLDGYEQRNDNSSENEAYYENLIFAEIFLHYAKTKKGEIALGLLTDDELINDDESSKLLVPTYIKEGLKWLME